MTLRQVLVQAGLAVAGLAAAYVTWQRTPELAADEAIALDITKNDLIGVRFEDQEKKTWVELAHATDENGPYVTVHLGPEDKPASAKEPQPAGKLPERLVRGSESAEKLFASFAPLRATRSLGTLDAAKLKELGLDAPKKSIVLSLRNGKHSFAIVPAPPGGSLPYLRDDATGRVYVVARSFLSDFQAAASMLVERKLHGFRQQEADRIVLAAAPKRRELVVLHNDDQVRLAPADAADKPDAALKTWHDRAFSVWPAEVLGQGESPAEGTPQVALRIDYTARGRRLGFLEVGKVAMLASPSTDAPKETLYARSERTLGWVKLGPDAQNLLGDAQPFLR